MYTVLLLEPSDSSARSAARRHKRLLSFCAPRSFRGNRNTRNARSGSTKALGVRFIACAWNERRRAFPCLLHFGKCRCRRAPVNMLKSTTGVSLAQRRGSLAARGAERQKYNFDLLTNWFLSICLYHGPFVCVIAARSVSPLVGDCSDRMHETQRAIRQRLLGVVCDAKTVCYAICSTCNAGPPKSINSSDAKN